MLESSSNKTLKNTHHHQRKHFQDNQRHHLTSFNSNIQHQQPIASTSSNDDQLHGAHQDSIVSPILFRPTLISTIAHHHLLHNHHHHHHHREGRHPPLTGALFNVSRHDEHARRHHIASSSSPSPQRVSTFRNQYQPTGALSDVLLSNRFIAYAEQSAYHDAISYAPLPIASSSSSSSAPAAAPATTASRTTNALLASKNGALLKISPTAHNLRLQHQKRLYGLSPTQHQIDLSYRRYFHNRTYCDLISRCGNRGLSIGTNLHNRSLGLTTTTTTNKSLHNNQQHHHQYTAHGGRGARSDWPYHSSIEMLDILRSLRSLLKISRIHTDGNIFRLHYSLTVIILMAFCIIITTKQYVGEPIDCLRAEGIDKSIINTFCWIHTTYSIPRAFNKKVGVDVPHPGVDNTNNPSEFQHHKYYQWVCFVLFVQAATFYIPRYLWKLWEAGKVEAVVMHLDVGVGFEPDLTLKKQAIVDYLYHSSGHHDWYAARYYFCECLSFVNVVAQMFLLNAFFEGEFFRYGLNVIEFTQLDQEDRVDPMIKIFPRVTKCKFYKYGPSANIETIDALCLLPLNIINEKIYIFLWFWFILLAILTFFMLIFGLIIIACPPVRVYMLNLRFRMSQLNHLHIIVRKSSIGDWFLLYLLGKNMDSYIFKDVIVDLAQRYMSKGKESDQRMLA